MVHYNLEHCEVHMRKKECNFKVKHFKGACFQIHSLSYEKSAGYFRGPLILEGKLTCLSNNETD